MTPTGSAVPTPALRGLVRANGFEAGWGGDYTTFPSGSLVNVVTGTAVHSGEYAAELPSSGFARNLTISLPSQAATFTDGIWACFADTLSNPPRRIRHWFNGVTSVVELSIQADARLRMNVAGYVGPPLITDTPLSTCPNYTRIEVQYRNLAAGGAAFLRMNGNLELFLTHVSPFTVTQSRIGVDDGDLGPPIRWDDHTLSNGVTWPGNLRILGLTPAADGFYGASWDRQNCAAGPRFPCVQARPPNTSVTLSDDTPLSRISFCPSQPPAAEKDAIIGVKTLVSVRETPDVAAPTGLFLRSGGCNDPGGTDHAEFPFDAPSIFTGFSRLDETDPSTGERWTPDRIAATEFGLRHPNDDETLLVTQLAVEVIYDLDAVTPIATATASLTATRTLTMTPTVSTTPTNTATPSETTVPSVTVATSTATRTRTVTATITDTPLTPVDTATATVTRTITPTPDMSSTPTDTPDGTVSTATVTATGTETATATPTGPTPTATHTVRSRVDYIFASGTSNNWECSVDASTALGLSGSVRTFNDLATREDPDRLHDLFMSVYVAPGLEDSDYLVMQQLSAPPSGALPLGGFINRFVSLGGLAIIHVAPNPNATPTTETRLDIAPRGVDYQPPLTSDAENIQAPAHPYMTGEGFGGEPLASTMFSGWGPTDRGHLVNVPADAIVLLRNTRGPTLVEYNHGAGKVLLSTLTFCTPSEPTTLGDPLDNLLKYGRFFRGGAQTPPPTVTSTPTATPTITGQATATSTRTRTSAPTPTDTETQTPSDTETPTPTPPPPCVGDCDGDGEVGINELLTTVNISLNLQNVSACPAGDVSGGTPSGPDGEITVDELIRGVLNALNGCAPPPAESLLSLASLKSLL